MNAFPGLRMPTLAPGRCGNRGGLACSPTSFRVPGPSTPCPSKIRLSRNCTFQPLKARQSHDSETTAIEGFEEKSMESLNGWLSQSAPLSLAMLAASSFLFLSPAAMALADPSALAAAPESLSEGFIQSFLLILFSEIGDKTFFIAVLLSLQNSRSAIFTGTFGALAIMTVISVGIGQSFHQLDGLIPADVAQFPLDDIFAAALLIVFGVQTLVAAKDADDNVMEERNEAQEVVSGLSAGAGGLILTTFGLVFAAEWGDKSFLATAALSAASSPVGVCLGAISGHAVATVIAVLGGSFLSKYISEKAVQYIGGSLFLVFALGTLVDLYYQVQQA
ncbi:hypothetical protein BSKO_10946 [Bryopsis sp. KO-2023]|nr:hypothetical protein BSKO_10946 [Bryopsis sp. KO-2023]